MESFVNHGGCLDGRLNAIMPEVIIKYLSTNTDQPLTTISLISHLITNQLNRRKKELEMGFSISMVG